MNMFEPMELSPGWLVKIVDIGWIKDNQIEFHGSFHVVEARLLGLTYPDYLRYLMSLGGEIRGKQGYSVVVFEDKETCERVCLELSKRWNIFQGASQIRSPRK